MKEIYLFDKMIRIGQNSPNEKYLVIYKDGIVAYDKAIELSSILTTMNSIPFQYNPNPIANIELYNKCNFSFVGINTMHSFTNIKHNVIACSMGIIDEIERYKKQLAMLLLTIDTKNGKAIYFT